MISFGIMRGGIVALILIASASSRSQGVSLWIGYEIVVEGNWDSAEQTSRQYRDNLKYPLSNVDSLDVLSAMASYLDNSFLYARALTGLRWAKERKADVNAMNGRPLWEAARKDDWQKGLRRLLEYGANPNLSPTFVSFQWHKGNTYTKHTYQMSSILMAAIQGKRTKNLEILLQHKANPDGLSRYDGKGFYVVSPSLHYPLGMAAKSGLVDAIPILIKFGAKVDAKEPKTGYTALHHAVAFKQTKCIAALLNGKAKRTLKDAKGRTPLALARKNKFAEGVRLLSR